MPLRFFPSTLSERFLADTLPVLLRHSSIAAHCLSAAFGHRASGASALLCRQKNPLLDHSDLEPLQGRGSLGQSRRGGLCVVRGSDLARPGCRIAAAIVGAGVGGCGRRSRTHRCCTSLSAPGRPAALRITLLDRGLRAVAGDNPAATISRLQRAGIGTAELIQIVDRVLVSPGSADRARLLLG